MNLKIDRYTAALLKENFLSFILIFVSVMVLIFIKNYYFSIYKKNKEKLNQLKTEIEKLERAKKQLEKFYSITNDVDKYYQTVNLLLPDKENIFTIISALENLSSTTGFYISGYTLSPVNEDNTVVTEVTITGFGNSQALLNLLKNYNFGSGRFITMEKVNYKSSLESTIKLVFKFHTRKSPELKDISQIISIDDEDLNWLENISNRVKWENLIPVYANDIIYRTKSNPFE